MKILLVDDSRTMRRIQQKVLAELKAEFSEAGDGAEALQLLEAGERFDLIVIDWHMPQMDGLALVQRIRETDTDTPLVMCTVEAEKPRVLEALAAGVNNYVIKPFTHDALRKTVLLTLAKAGKLAV